jgi:hypothetical protein
MPRTHQHGWVIEGIVSPTGTLLGFLFLKELALWRRQGVPSFDGPDSIAIRGLEGVLSSLVCLHRRVVGEISGWGGSGRGLNQMERKCLVGDRNEAGKTTPQGGRQGTKKAQGAKTQKMIARVSLDAWMEQDDAEKQDGSNLVAGVEGRAGWCCSESKPLGCSTTDTAVAQWRPVRKRTDSSQYS